MSKPSPTDQAITFRGRVLPEHRRVTIPLVDKIHYTDPTGLNAYFEIRVKRGKVRITCTPIKGKPEPALCLARAYEIANGLTDLYAFTKG